MIIFHFLETKLAGWKKAIWILYMYRSGYYIRIDLDIIYVSIWILYMYLWHLHQCILILSESTVIQHWVPEYWHYLNTESNSIKNNESTSPLYSSPSILGPLEGLGGFWFILLLHLGSSRWNDRQTYFTYAYYRFLLIANDITESNFEIFTNYRTSPSNQIIFSQV